jgi:glycosyltransferase involved in cell wall biosynthesis
MKDHMQHSSRKRLLFILPSLSCGGAERVVLNFLSSIDNSKYEATLLVIKSTLDLKDELPEYIRFVNCLSPGEKIRLGFPKVIYKIMREASRSDIVIGALELTATYFAYLGSFLCGKPVIGWVHTNVQEYFEYIERTEGKIRRSIHLKLSRIIYPRLDSLIAVSNGVKESIIKSLSCSPEKIKVIYNPVDIQRIRGLSEIPSRIQLGKPYIISVGRMVFPKGFDILIRAYAEVLKNSIEHDLLIIGDGPERGRITELIRQLGLDKKVIVTGFMENPFNVIKNADMFVMSSRFEGFGLVLCEAMALGVPVIATDCRSGPREILNNGEYGILVPTEDESKLADSIVSLLRNPEKRHMLSQKGILRAEEFNAAKAVNEFESTIVGMTNCS